MNVTYRVTVVYKCDGVLIGLPIDPLHSDVTIRIVPYSGNHVEEQKCIAVIERRVLIVSLYANTSDYSNKTCIYMYT